MSVIENEPKSWGELLKQRESERNRPPPREFYNLQPQIIHKEGGIFSDTRKTGEGVDEIERPTDDRLYSSTQIFDNPFDPPPPPQPIKPSRDHGNGPFVWPHGFEARREREEKDKQTLMIPKPRFSRDFDIISGESKSGSFKETVSQRMNDRNKEQQFRMNRKFDIISNTFPTLELETTRLQNEALEREAFVTRRREKMPKPVQRSESGSLNVITGEYKNEEALNAIDEFPHSDINRGMNKLMRESQIVQTREIAHDKEAARIPNRYNNMGRSRMLRDFNIISNQEQHQCMDASVKPRPSIWQWCQMEKLDV